MWVNGYCCSLDESWQNKVAKPKNMKIETLKGRCYYCITLEFSMECEVLILVYFLSEVDNFDPSF